MKEFHDWLFVQKVEYMVYRAEDGAMLSFAEYLSARTLFFKEIKNG